jgi:ABC-type branched-subunit amino acid transport system substrate-binding protein
MTTDNVFQPLSRRERTVSAVAAVIASCVSLSAVVGLFDSGGSTPWFAIDQAGQVANCAPVREATQRHACLRAVARQAPTTRVAAR